MNGKSDDRYCVAEAMVNLETTCFLDDSKAWQTQLRPAALAE